MIEPFGAPWNLRMTRPRGYRTICFNKSGNAKTADGAVSPFPVDDGGWFFLSDKVVVDTRSPCP